MPGTAEPTGRRILDSAYELFYRKGFNRVGVDEIAALAGVTKRSLYYHFKSKDDLLMAVLDRHRELALARIRKYEHRYSTDPDEMLDLLFSELAKWTMKPRWSGAGFTRVVMELADLPGHPAHAVARRHKTAIEAWYAEMLQRAQIPNAAEHAREIALLVEGATALILIHGDRSYATAAARAAQRLIRRATGDAAARRVAEPTAATRGPRGIRAAPAGQIRTGQSPALSQD